MAKILTEGEVAPIGDINVSFTSNRCCTRSQAEYLNCTVTGPSGAASNQLIYSVSKANDYFLDGASGTGSSPYTFTSSKNGSWCDVSITVISGSVRQAILTHSGTTGSIAWTHGGSSDEQIRITQSGSNKQLVVTLKHTTYFLDGATSLTAGNGSSANRYGFVSSTRANGTGSWAACTVTNYTGSIASASISNSGINGYVSWTWKSGTKKKSTITITQTASGFTLTTTIYIA